MSGKGPQRTRRCEQCGVIAHKHSVCWVCEIRLHEAHQAYLCSCGEQHDVMSTSDPSRCTECAGEGYREPWASSGTSSLDSVYVYKCAGEHIHEKLTFLSADLSCIDLSGLDS
jgi:hypothetical protein